MCVQIQSTSNYVSVLLNTLYFEIFVSIGEVLENSGGRTGKRGLYNHCAEEWF